MAKKQWKLLEVQTVPGDDFFGKGSRRTTWKIPSGDKKVFGEIFQPDCATVFALTSNLNVIAVELFKPGRKRAKDNGFGIELPAGALKTSPGSNPEELARLALLNETGYEAENWNALAEGMPYLMASLSSPTVVNLYMATGCHQVAEPKPRPPGEEIRVKLFTLREWIKIVYGRFKCGKPKMDEWSAFIATTLGLVLLGRLDINDSLS